MARSYRRMLGGGLLWLAAATAAAAPRVGVATMTPGETYWERFGHNAIVLVEDGREPLFYNYGMFDFDEPGFLARFLRGRMRYRLAVQTVDESLDYYASVGRGLDVQWLDLSDGQAEALAEFLRWNALPENAYYRYDYFADNCSTRVRDALDAALGGALKRQWIGRSRGLTYRSEALRLGRQPLWMGLGMSLGLGPAAEQALSRWTESYVPQRLAEALREARTAAGTPLVLAEQTPLPHRLDPVPAAPPRWWPRFLLTGLVLAGAAWWAARRAPRALALGAGAFWLLAGLAGLGLSGLWAFTEHVWAYRNENLLLLNPLALGLLPLAWARWRGRPDPRWLRPLAGLLALLAGLAAFLKFMPFHMQDNLDWIALLLPLHWALYRAFGAERVTDLSTSPRGGRGERREDAENIL